jgi:uncharacterized protein
LTASADGSTGGFPVVVFGGEHGDLPLPPAGGALIADVVVDTGVSAILDLSDLSNAQIAAFVLAFAARLYERKARARSPLLLVIEEADEVAPQRAMPDQTRMLGAVERVVKRGRMRGIGTLMISQRSASLNKNVLSQAELLIAMQTTAPQDIKAIDAWIEHHGDQEQRQQLISEIATLRTGEAFVWSPGWLHEFRKIRFRLRRTFDSSATPKPGEVLAEPATRAAVDLDAIRARLGAVIGEGEPTTTHRDQTRALAEQRRLLEEKDAYILAMEGELRQVRARPSGPSEALIQKAAEVFVRADRALTQAESIATLAQEVRRAARELRDMLDDDAPAVAVPIVEPATRPTAFTETRDRRKPASRTARPTQTVAVTAPQQRLLDTLAAYEVLGALELDRRTLAVSAGVSPRSSAYDANVRALRSAGLVVYPTDGYVALINPGRDLAQIPPSPPTLYDLHTGWMRLLSKPQAVLLTILIGTYPGSLTREALAEMAGVSRRSSAFEANIRHLRGLGLAAYPVDNEVAATDLLFPEGLR